MRRFSRITRRHFVPLTLALALSPGAHAAQRESRAATVTPSQFAPLRWLDGAWRGRMADGAFFWERYRFVDDTTIQMAQFTDSTFTRSTEGDRLRLRAGTVRYENVVATRVDAAGIEFSTPDGRFGFTWTRRGPDAWTATIRNTSADGRARTEVYELERYRPASEPAMQERERVRLAVLDYVEGFYEGDSARLVRSVWPQVLKYGYARDRATGGYRGMRMTYPEGFMNYARGVREGRNRTPENAPREIAIFDVQDQTASARLRAWWGTDYLLLARENGRWMITHVLWQSPPPER